MFPLGVGLNKRTGFFLAVALSFILQFRYGMLLNAQLGIYCGEFRVNDKASCTCSVNRTAANAACRTLGLNNLAEILIAITNDTNGTVQSSSIRLCYFDEYFTGRLKTPLQHKNNSCKLEQTANNNKDGQSSKMTEIFTLRAIFQIENSSYDGKYVTCLSGCEGGNLSSKILTRNTSGVLITFGRSRTNTSEAGPALSVGVLVAIVSSTTFVLLIILAIACFFGVRYQRKRAWVVSKPTKRICYDGPLPVQLPRTPDKKKMSTPMSTPMLSNTVPVNPAGTEPVPKQQLADKPMSGEKKVPTITEQSSLSTDVDTTDTTNGDPE